MQCRARTDTVGLEKARYRSYLDPGPSLVYRCPIEKLGLSSFNALNKTRLVPVRIAKRGEQSGNLTIPGSNPSTMTFKLYLNVALNEIILMIVKTHKR